MKTKNLFVLIIVVALFIISCDNKEPADQQNDQDSTLIDSRDGKVYVAVQIGSQLWMAENLNYDCGNGSWVYDDDPANADIYGRLYNWETACSVCPEDWHLPTYDEWNVLIDFLGGFMVAGTELKDTNTILWIDHDLLLATNSSGFSAIPGGLRRPDENYYFIGYMAFFWSASEDEPGSNWVYSIMLEHEEPDVERDEISKMSGLSVRCIKD